jgi:hypothetical protein
VSDNTVSSHTGTLYDGLCQMTFRATVATFVVMLGGTVRRV